MKPDDGLLMSDTELDAWCVMAATRYFDGEIPEGDDWQLEADFLDWIRTEFPQQAAMVVREIEVRWIAEQVIQRIVEAG